MDRKKREVPAADDFDFAVFEAEAIKSLYDGKPISGKDGVITPLIKRLLEKAMQGEMDAHMEAEESDKNRRNGKTSKTLKSTHGPFELETPRDRNSTFEPQLVKKRQTTLPESLENKVLSLYGLGMSYQDISGHMEELYGLELSPAALSMVTDKILPMIREWQARPLDEVYPFVWMDALHYKAREEGHVISKAVYTVLGVNRHGMKEVLGFYLSETEGAKFWLQVLTDLSNRGVKDILIACIDNLKGFADAIESIYPQAEVQLCVVHQIRNSLKYVAGKDQKVFMNDLKKVYRASSKELAEANLDSLESTWGKKYPVVIKSWRVNWDRLSRYFKYPEDIRRIIYTTNTVEGFHRQVRKVTKTKGAFTSESALLKLLYMAVQNILKKWTQPIRNWSVSVSQLAVFFEGRMKLDLEVG